MDIKEFLKNTPADAGFDSDECTGKGIGDGSGKGSGYGSYDGHGAGFGNCCGYGGYGDGYGR